MSRIPSAPRPSPSDEGSTPTGTYSTKVVEFIFRLWALFIESGVVYRTQFPFGTLYPAYIYFLPLSLLGLPWTYVNDDSIAPRLEP